MIEEIKGEWKDTNTFEKTAIVLIFAGIAFLFFGALFRYVWFSPELLASTSTFKINVVQSFNDPIVFAIPAYVEYNVARGDSSFYTPLLNAPFSANISNMGVFTFANAILDNFSVVGKMCLALSLFLCAAKRQKMIEAKK